MTVMGPLAGAIISYDTVGMISMGNGVLVRVRRVAVSVARTEISPAGPQRCGYPPGLARPMSAVPAACCTEVAENETTLEPGGPMTTSPVARSGMTNTSAPLA